MGSVLIAGYYGAGNLGDEAILTAIISALRAVDSKVQIQATSLNPNQTSRQHQIQGIDWRDINQQLESVRQADLVIIGGGGLFQDYWGFDPEGYLRIHHRGISFYGGFSILAEVYGIPCVLYGVGLGPLFSRSARDHTCQIARRCRHITLRDQASYQLLVDAGFDPAEPESPPVSVFTDPAFDLFADQMHVDQANQIFASQHLSEEIDLLGINLRYWDRPEKPRKWLPSIAEGIRSFLLPRNNLHAVLLPFQEQGENSYTDDQRLCRQLQNLVDIPERTHLLSGITDPGVMQAVINRCQLFIGMRLHSLIFSLANKIPCAAIAYDPKVYRLMADAGMVDLCLPLQGIKSQDMYDRIQSLERDKRQIALKLEKFSQQQQRKAEQQAAILEEMIKFERKEPDLTVLQNMFSKWVKDMMEFDHLMNQKDQFISQLKNERQQLRQELSQLEKDLNQVQSSRIFRAVSRLAKIRNFLIPPGSRRESLWYSLIPDK